MAVQQSIWRTREIINLAIVKPSMMLCCQSASTPREQPEKNIPPPKGEGIFFGAPAGISPNGDKLRLPGSDQKKSPRQKGEEIFLVLQRGFEPRTPCLKGRCSAY